MSGIIKLTPEILDEVCRDFELNLKKSSPNDGKIAYTKELGRSDRKATLSFTETAWYKMKGLIDEFDKEVAWHGVASRGDDESEDKYYVTDILVYPQMVTGASVNTDQMKYEMWLMAYEDDVFNNIRMHGHSHVNMSVNPSLVDSEHSEKILAQLDDDMFYIFMIWNKRGERNIKIYDLAKNILFDNADVLVEITGDKIGLTSFLVGAKEMVQDESTHNFYVDKQMLHWLNETEAEDRECNKDQSHYTSKKRKGRRKLR